MRHCVKNTNPIEMMDLLALAAADYVRWWQSVDAPLMMGIEKQASKGVGSGPLDAQAVLTISKLYGFRRSMIAKPYFDQIIAETFSVHIRQGDSLKSQAVALCAVVENLSARMQDHAGDGARPVRNLASGASKLAWFVDPTGWTPFDTIAGKGIDHPSGDALVRMVRFYAKLDAIQFLDMATLINDHIEHLEIGFRVSERNRVRGERFIDRFLMFRGMPPERRKAETDITKYYVACLDADQRSRVDALMAAIKCDRSLTDLVVNIGRRVNETRYQREI